MDEWVNCPHCTSRFQYHSPAPAGISSTRASFTDEKMECPAVMLSAPSHTPRKVLAASESEACLSNKHLISLDLRFLDCKHLYGEGGWTLNACSLGPGAGDHTLHTLLP